MNKKHIVNKYTSNNNLDYYYKFDDAIPRSIKYIKENIFKTIDGNCFIIKENENISYLHELKTAGLNEILKKMAQINEKDGLSLVEKKRRIIIF